MAKHTRSLELPIGNLSDETSWKQLYPLLQSLARHFVYAFNVSSWHGQEEDIIDDVVQETAVRLLERARRAERGEATPIHSLEHIIWTIVCNYCIDIRRRDLRLVRTLSEEYLPEGFIVLDKAVNPIERATEKLYQEEIFTLVAYEIANFPDKQRKALLTDLANLMRFDIGPTPLQASFLAAGIQLQEYQQPLPVSHRERSRHSSLLSIAYKRLAQLPCLQKYIFAA